MSSPFQINPSSPFAPPFDPTRPRVGDDEVPGFIQHAIRSTSRADMALIRTIVDRLVSLAAQYKMLIPSSMSVGLDLCIAHARRPVRLQALLLVNDDEFSRELLAIVRNVDRTNGMLREGFVSRYVVA